MEEKLCKSLIKKKEDALLNGERITIAYLIIAYEDPQQLAKQVEKLAEYSDTYIHINKRTKITPFKQAVEQIHANGKIFFANHRYRVNWGGYSILKATFSLLEQALENKRYDRIVLLTGLDYPIKTSEQIQNFFIENRNKDFISAKVANGLEYECLNYRQCRDFIVFKLLFSGLAKYIPNCRIVKKKDFIEYNNKIYKIYGISPKWALRGSSAEYMLDFYRKNPSFNRYFKFMHAPDDFYFATVLNHSDLKDNIVDAEKLFYIRWKPNNEGAKILGMEDFEIVKSVEALYAKKFKTGISDELIKSLSI